MTTLEAYELTMEKIDELKNDGLEVYFKKYPEDLIDQEIINKYNDNEHIPYQYWKDVTFKNVDKIEKQKINNVLSYLSLCGICFDLYGGLNERTWQLDWSFKYTGKTNDEWMENNDSLEFELEKCNL